MIFFEMDGKILTIIYVGLIVMLSSCGLHFREDKFDAGLLEIGQLTAQHNCKKNINYQAYQDCITQVDENYDAATSEFHQSRRRY